MTTSGKQAAALMPLPLPLPPILLMLMLLRLRLMLVEAVGKNRSFFASRLGPPTTTFPRRALTRR